MSPARSSEPVAVGLLLCAHAGTDRRTDTVLFHRPCYAYCPGSASNYSDRSIVHCRNFYLLAARNQSSASSRIPFHRSNCFVLRHVRLSRERSTRNFLYDAYKRLCGIDGGGIMFSTCASVYQSHLSKLLKLNNKILRILQNAPLKFHTLSLGYTKIIPPYRYHCYTTFRFCFLSINFYTLVTKRPLYLHHISPKIHLCTMTIREKNTAYI